MHPCLVRRRKAEITYGSFLVPSHVGPLARAALPSRISAPALVDLRKYLDLTIRIESNAKTGEKLTLCDGAEMAHQQRRKGMTGNECTASIPAMDEHEDAVGRKLVHLPRDTKLVQAFQH